MSQPQAQPQGARRRSREYALQLLYSFDAQGMRTVDVNHSVRHFWNSFEDEPDLAVKDFCETLVRGVTEHLIDLDSLIQAVSKNWRLDRMARVDRNILRLASYELRFGKEAPARVIINEAIEIAKRFGTAESPAFVNGLLDRIAQETGGMEETG